MQIKEIRVAQVYEDGAQVWQCIIIAKYQQTRVSIRRTGPTWKQAKYFALVALNAAVPAEYRLDIEQYLPPGETEAE